MAVGVRGLAGVHKKAEELAAQRQSFGLRRFTPEFRWDGNKPAAENALNLRLLGDELIVPTKQHRGVPLPENKFFFGICRHAEPIEADFCHVCDVLAPAFEGDQKQKKRSGLIPVDIAVGLAVEMEEKREGRVLVGWKPKMVEFQIPDITDGEKKDEATAEEREYRKLLNRLGNPGTKVSIPNIGLLVGTISGQQALWDYATRRKQMSDRVFEISRHGKALDTKWDWNHEGPDNEPDPSAMLVEYAAKYPFELPEEWVARNAAEDRYNYFFKIGDAAAEAATPTAGDKDDDVKPVASSRDALMERLKGQG